MQSLISNIDLFVTVPRIQSFEALAFFQLAVPQVSPSLPPFFTFSDLFFLRLDPTVEVSLQIDKFPVEAALSNFISDVFPQDFDLCLDDLEKDEVRLAEEAHVSKEEKDVAYQRTSGSEATEIEVSKKSKGQIVKDIITQRHKLMQFETPELDEPVESVSCFESKGVQILSQAPEIEESSEILKPALATHDSCSVLESFLFVEDIAFENPMEEKPNLEDDSTFQDHFPFNLLGFPTLEVDETFLESISGFSAEKKLLSYFETIEIPDSGKENLESEDKENWGGKEYDISVLISDHFLSGPSLGSEIGSVDNFQEVDLIALVETHIGMKYIVQGASDADHFLSDQPLVFDEFRFLDLDSAQVFEAVYNSQWIYKPESSSEMFNEETNFQRFNNLVVSHELTLVDDTFKSLPVPVIRDRIKLRSFHEITEGKFASLKLHPMSALDEIYLDWHLLDEDKHNCHTYYCKSIVGDTVAQNIEFDLDLLGDRNVSYEFILSDDNMSRFDKEENKELKEFLPGVFVSAGITTGVGSSGKFSPPVNAKQWGRKNSGKGSLSFKSMSRSNDLDFFLYSQKAPVGANCETVHGASHNKTASPKAPLRSSIAAIPQERQSSMSLHSGTNVTQKELFDDISVDDICDLRANNAMGKVDYHSLGVPNTSIPFAEEPKHPHGDLVSLPETVILVNTQNLDKEMIVSRRSTYQRILALEKEGAQVVERDSDLPVDIIVNCAICLVWYNDRNIGKKATALDEASSSLPLCIENIATNVLTLLSFNFSGCIMVFEGDNSYLSTVMEFSDELYAAAASLGIDVQLFCSYSSDSTDEIIVNCLQYATRGVYPRMSESETLAESFLSKFPSVNPFTAHAILSLGGLLSEFLEWSNEKRIHATQNYHVPRESIDLLSALCKYGERDDSRSIMTDCSSSVSSGTDSKSYNLNIASERKRYTPDGSLNKSSMHMDDSLHVNPVKRFRRDTVESPLVQKSYDSFMSKEHKSFHEYRNPRQYHSNPFHEEPDSVATPMNDPHGKPKPKPCDFQTPLEPQMFEKTRMPEFSFSDKLSDQLPGTDEAMLNRFDHVKGTRIPFEDQKGEVIDLTGSPRLGKNSSSIDDSISFLMPEFEDDARRKSKAARRLSFGKNHQTTSLENAELLSGKNMWNSSKFPGRNSVGAHAYPDFDFGDDILIKNHPTHNQSLEDRFNQRSESSRGLQSRENESSHFGGTLKNALGFSSPGNESPWTMDFLNKIRDKSRLRHQSLPCDGSTTVSLSGNISKEFKRRSPSILEFFKYQGSSIKRVPEQKKLSEQKKQKRTVQSASSSKVVKPSASIPSTWTPLDKRARQTLSYRTYTGERQARLVWNDGHRNRRNKFQNHI